MFGIFKFFKEKPEEPKTVKKQKIRSFKAAQTTRFTNWLYSSFTKINQDMKHDLKTMVTRCRDLSKNNEIFRSHLNNFEKSIIGNKGFKLQSLVKDEAGTLIEIINNELENAWYEYGKRSNGYITKDGQMGDLDLDALILRTLLIDGEVFIRIDRDAKNPFGLSFEIIDGLCIDTEKNQIETEFQNAIVCGVEVDRNCQPVKYYFKRGNTDNYGVGVTEEIPAAEIIHIYKKEFVGQVRGFPELCASLDSLKQLDDYAIAELFAAKVAACNNVFYERNGNTAGDWLEQQKQDAEDPGKFIQEMSPGEASIVPQGYTVKSVSPTHPNTNFGGFCKAIVRRIASAVGVSYNRLAHDYESVNYSSLREASIDEAKTYITLQRFLVDNWKSIQYELFVKSYLANTQTKLKPSKYKEYLNYQFICRRDGLFDAAKEIVSVERKLKLGLSNPIIELESMGMDVEEVLDGWKRWQEMLDKRGLQFNADNPLPLDVMQQVMNENDDEENVNNNI